MVVPRLELTKHSLLRHHSIPVAVLSALVPVTDASERVSPAVIISSTRRGGGAIKDDYSDSRSFAQNWFVLEVSKRSFVRRLKRSDGSGVYIWGWGQWGGHNCSWGHGPCHSEPPLTRSKLCFIINFIEGGTEQPEFLLGAAAPWPSLWTAPAITNKLVCAGRSPIVKQMRFQWRCDTNSHDDNTSYYTTHLTGYDDQRANAECSRRQAIWRALLACAVVSEFNNAHDLSVCVCQVCCLLVCPFLYRYRPAPRRLPTHRRHSTTTAQLRWRHTTGRVSDYVISDVTSSHRPKIHTDTPRDAYGAWRSANDQNP